MIYHSKKDAWLVALASGSILIPFLIGIYLLFAPGGHTRVAWIMLVIAAITGAALLLLTYPLYYEVTPTDLIIRSGIFIRQQVPLSEIREVSLTRTPLGAPAWSLDRLEVDYNHNGEEDFVLISPEDKIGFMRDLVTCAKSLELQGERVVRVSK